MIMSDDKSALLDRLLSKVHKTDSCWNWTGQTVGRKADGKYGILMHDRKRWCAHRLFYHLLVGPIPVGIYVCHKCDNPRCVNPDHLFLGTPKDNTQDCVRKGRIRNGNMGKTHCKHGHPLTTDNIYTSDKRYRARKCKICAKESQRRQYSRITQTKRNDLWSA